MNEKDSADYEESEKIAIAAGKKALKRAHWLFNRIDERATGSFVELRENDKVHPDYLSVHCVDGNGTKLFLSAWSNNYRLAPIDAIAMNANDMAAIINAYPSSVDLYMACQTGVEENHMDEIMSGFVNALEKCRIPNAPFDLNMGKIETASLDEMISLGIPDKGVDFGVVMTGFIEKDKVPNLTPLPGDLIIGVSSTGMHSNGYTGARHVLLAPDPALEPREEWRKQYKGKFSLNDTPDILEGKTVLEALQVPTAIYLVEAALIGKEFSNPYIYGINITGNGLHNFNRVGSLVSFKITDPLDPLPIHKLLMLECGWTLKEALTKQNMGMGFAYIVPKDPDELAAKVVDFINERGENKAKIIGRVEEDTKAKKQIRTILHNGYGIKTPIEFIGYSN